jgi:hypothetical protein
MAVKSEIINELGSGTLEIFPVEATETFLYTMLKDIFENYWQEIHFGILIQGAAWEIKAPNAPTHISLLDGYLTVNFGSWHFHLCIGEYKGSSNCPADPELTRIRRTSRAEFYRLINNEYIPQGWGFRMFNGNNEQQLTIFLPNPFLTSDMNVASIPDWSKLALWNYLRKKYLGLQPDPKDQECSKFAHH